LRNIADFRILPKFSWVFVRSCRRIVAGTRFWRFPAAWTLSVLRILGRPLIRKSSADVNSAFKYGCLGIRIEFFPRDTFARQVRISANESKQSVSAPAISRSLNCRTFAVAHFSSSGRKGGEKKKRKRKKETGEKDGCSRARRILLSRVNSRAIVEVSFRSKTTTRDTQTRARTRTRTGDRAFLRSIGCTIAV